MTTTGYIDLQVNGYGGVDFNSDALTADALHSACERMQADGVSAFLSTVITDDLKAMCRRLARLAQLREGDPLAARLIAGIHIEGPFINRSEGFRGAHPGGAVIPGDVDAMQRLLDAAGGLTRIVTLAPECDDDLRVTRLLARNGVIVSAGHTDASLDQLRAGIDAGLRMFTHVGNGCPMTLHRHDNIIQRALSLSRSLWLSFIADGAHVPPPALGNYLRLAGCNRCVIVSDAIAPAGLGPGAYTLGRQTVVVHEDMVPRAPGGSHFIGSAVTMRQSAEYLQGTLGLSPDAVHQLTVSNPRAVLGL